MIRRIVIALALLVPKVALAQPADNGGALHRDGERKPFYVRVGGLFMQPFASSGPMVLSGVDGPASLAIQNGPIAGSGVHVGAAWDPGLIVGYRLPFLHRRISIETILGLPITVKFTATGTLANQSLAPTVLGIATGVMPLGPEMGQSKAIPPVVTATYSIIDHGMVQPYVGTGVALLFAYDAKVTNPTLVAAGSPELTVSPGAGWVLQGGVDLKIYRQWFFRLDVKYIAFLQANAVVHDVSVTTPNIPLFGDVSVGTAKLTATLNPVIFQAGIGLDF